MNMHNTIGTSIIVKHGILALFGGIVHALNSYREGKSKSFLDVIILTIISSFSGVLFSFIALHFYDSSYFSLAVAGSGGFLGVEGLGYLTKFIKKAVLANIK